MNTPAPMSENEREDLTAYLDGELDEEQARAVEARLSQDPAARAEADALKHTWDLLDYLPRPEPSPTFTHRTLDRINTRETQTALARRKRRRWVLAAASVAALLLGLIGGYAGYLRWVPNRPTEDDLVRDLRLIDNLRFYQDAETFDFLQQLAEPELFGDDGQDT